ncbi:hypothetical protein CRENBAI_018556 [Crenichthys baileyi]|uniref:Uncharacterized protein n=1 Tax=Crenichthys baileyi TaxID=28760 RepID=A0AAV9RIU6_9TELE
MMGDRRTLLSAEGLDNPVKYWENIAWSDVPEAQLFRCPYTHHVWRLKEAVQTFLCDVKRKVTKKDYSGPAKRTFFKKSC